MLSQLLRLHLFPYRSPGRSGIGSKGRAGLSRLAIACFGRRLERRLVQRLATLESRPRLLSTRRRAPRPRRPVCAGGVRASAYVHLLATTSGGGGGSDADVGHLGPGSRVSRLPVTAVRDPRKRRGAPQGTFGFTGGTERRGSQGGLVLLFEGREDGQDSFLLKLWGWGLVYVTEVPIKTAGTGSLRPKLRNEKLRTKRGVRKAEAQFGFCPVDGTCVLRSSFSFLRRL